MRFLCAAILSAATLAGPAAAAPLAEPKPLARTAQTWQDLRASTLLAAKAVDLQGRELGKIEDLIISTRTGAVHYAIVSFGGRLELGERLYTYPVSALAPGRSPDEVVVQVNREDLGKSTGVAELESWLRRYDPNATIADRRFIPASELLGKAVDDREGARAGEVEDLVLNLGSGLLRHVVVELRGGKQVALPLRAFKVPILRERDLVADLTAVRPDSSTGR